ncbi:calcium-binding protein [Rhizobium alvei]|uniref:Calcium-binding protein n=1 Tax=Rhizobium alvei TaxID=1132659 RepID=A0ABT8YJP2_9HYPH|nr:calcium-binding protein [Rhizobium alvei]MDO6963548.1 calcium-binding protein [Rhizobium alvei]
MVTTINATSAFMEDFIERSAERLQDMNRAGFQNMGGNDAFSSSANQSFRLNGQSGADTIQLIGLGNDTIHTGSGDDFVFSGRGNDTMSGGSGRDRLYGDEGNDTISGGSGDDDIQGGIGVDTIRGGGNNDKLFGGAGTDMIYGGTGNDELYGDHDGSSTSQQGRDYLYGGYGNDRISGGGNADIMYGEAGADTFVFDHINDFVFGHSDMIGDFSRTELDRIDLQSVDANSLRSGNQTFDFVDGPSTIAGTLWLGAASNGQQRVFMNVDGGNADLDIIVKLDDATMTSLQESDFLL